jgi:hypothetical protein
MKMIILIEFVFVFGFFGTARSKRLSDSNFLILIFCFCCRCGSHLRWTCRNPSRMHNMILAVGPGTPASVCWGADEDDDDDEADSTGNEYNDDNTHDDGSESDNEGSESNDRVARMPDAQSDDEEDDHDDGSESDNESNDSNERMGKDDDARVSMETDTDSDDDDEEESELEDPTPFRFRQRSNWTRNDNVRSRPRQQQRQREQEAAVRNWRPSMRHEGCINTACWLDCPWRLSLAGANGSVVPSSGLANAVSSLESTTQLVTSGDDRTVKFWDVRDAMGSANPLSGGWDTLCPFASTKRPHCQSYIRSSWKEHCCRPDLNVKVAGSVYNLASMNTGHRLNVFDVKPVSAQPGKVLTCAADGYLRLCDLQENRSSVVIHPLADETDAMSHLFSSGAMAFSHHFLNANTGLLCSERGLHRFDLRLSPREQQSESVLPGSNTCKACAVWAPFGSPSNGDVDSTFVFAGGTSDFVGLYDLRMEGSRLECLQKYKPLCFDSESGAAVSGLDVSKDGKELLVSYEGDSIYTFPTFYKSSSAAGPTLEEVKQFPSAWFSGVEGEETHLPELASYGGHLNRRTFLKNARYAGPNDEYICTGSDSGHAWIYERSSGAVVSFLGADTVTCNGVIPHPSLPVFVTYGIDSTAKLWRGTGPVDCKVDDSPAGRAKCSEEQRYEMSPICASWNGVQCLLRRFGGNKGNFLPDYVASTEEISDRDSFASSRKRGIDGYDSPPVGNTMRALPFVLRQNRFQCYRAIHQNRECPVESVLDFDHRVSVIRSRNQADRLGLPWNANVPWLLKPVESKYTKKIHPADLVLDNPSDWIEYDGEMVLAPVPSRSSFFPEHYSGDKHDDDFTFLAERYTDLTVLEATPPVSLSREHITLSREHVWLENRGSSKDDEKPWLVLGESESSIPGGVEFKTRSRRYFYETARLLKEGGNKAMNAGSLNLAARRYDKAIQYCAVAFMRYEAGRGLSHLTKGHCIDDSSTEASQHRIVVWSPLLKVLITSHLNMALLLLKPEFKQTSRASDQAKAALLLLAPFSHEKGKVIVTRENNEKVIVKDSEPRETFKEAKLLQSKAFFRLGCAELELGHCKPAICVFEESMKASSANKPGCKPDSLVVRRLREAKIKLKSKKQRDRKRFERFMAEERS